MQAWRILVLGILLGLGGEVAATRVYRRTLEEVLTPEKRVIRARLVTARVEILPDELQVQVQVELAQTLRGAEPTPLRFTHSFSTRLERNGLRVSPIRDGSGSEQSLETGRWYYFIIDPSGQFLIRAEYDEAGARIRRLLQLPDAR